MTPNYDPDRKAHDFLYDEPDDIFDNRMSNDYFPMQSNPPVKDDLDEDILYDPKG